jgi:hypothetical protein
LDEAKVATLQEQVSEHINFVVNLFVEQIRHRILDNVAGDFERPPGVQLGHNSFLGSTLGFPSPPPEFSLWIIRAAATYPDKVGVVGIDTLTRLKGMHFLGRL